MFLQRRQDTQDLQDPKNYTGNCTLCLHVFSRCCGSIIGSFFMTEPALAVVGGVTGWAILNAMDGLIGRTTGGGLVNMLIFRKAMNIAS